jgi:ribosomal protein S20
MFKQLVIVILFVASFGFEPAYAAGSTVNEDFSLIQLFCDDMIEAAKKEDQPLFLELADKALKLSEAQRRDNSMAIDRFRPKIRFAKKAAAKGDFDSAIGYLEEAKPLMKAAPTSWDGGS